MSTPYDVVVALGACRRAVQLYPPSHPAFREALNGLESAVQDIAANEPFVLNVHQGRLYRGSIVISDEGAGVQSVAEALEERSIESLTFLPSLTRSDVLGLVEMLTMRPGPQLDVNSELNARRVVGITVAFLAEASEVEEAREREERDRLRDQDRALYNQLLASLRSISQQLAAGGGADLSQASGMVSDVLGRLLEDPSAMLALATIRGAGERTLFHSLNVMIYSLALGDRLGLPEESLPTLGTAALLHDIGKSAFNADDPLQAQQMRTLHPQVGAEILQRVSLDDPAPFLAAYEHHMHVDGTGFPERPDRYIAHPYSRMIAVANHYENLTNATPDRAALTPDRAVLQVLRDASTVLDPFFARLFASALGVFPVGCLVRLSDQSVGVVERPGTDPLRPQIRLTFDASGAELERPESLNLDAGDVRIVEVIAQESINIEASDKLCVVLPLGMPTDAVENLGDKGQPPAAVLARVNELLNLVAKLWSGVVANQSARAAQNLSGAQIVDFRFDFFDTTTQSACQSGGVDHGSRVAVEEHDYVPRQKRSDVLLNELRDRGSENPFKVVQVWVRPQGRANTHPRAPLLTGAPSECAGS